jgi:hypothetical protein
MLFGGKMKPDIRPWYHLLYITDQIKSADQKAYLAIAVVCAVIGFSHQGYARVIQFLLNQDASIIQRVALSISLLLCVAGLLMTLSRFYTIVFPKVKSARYIAHRDKSAIFWFDVASMKFDDFRDQYLNENREEDLIIQIYVLSKIAQHKYGSIRSLFSIAVFTIICDVLVFAVSKTL